jgi:hypothetical protein
MRRVILINLVKIEYTVPFSVFFTGVSRVAKLVLDLSPSRSKSRVVRELATSHFDSCRVAYRSSETAPPEPVGRVENLVLPPSLPTQLHLSTFPAPPLQLAARTSASINMAAAPYPSFAENERVLCYHGPMIYEAKILQKKYFDEEPPHGGETGQYYFVHYKGWKKK